tara:strand:+ start:353 stop:2134 length:1782 start_codon:yes stop_codon:yes gene_type:complete
MNRKLILFSFSLIILTSYLFSQQGKYARKSVSSLETAWIKPGGAKNTRVVDTDILNALMKFYIEIPRFDFNTLPEEQVDDFNRQANNLDSVNVSELSKVMENTVVKKILEILNDPDIQMQRGKNLKSDSDFETFAATKAKSLGLNTEQLASLMNSAYIYLPFIEKIQTFKDTDEDEPNKERLQVKIEGGIIWWKVKVDSEGNAKIENVLEATTSSSNSISLVNGAAPSGSSYSRYTFGDQSFSTTPQTYVQAGAMLAFAKNLNVKTRELSDFKLQAQVVEKNRRSYNFNLGLTDGVHLDDGFFLIELTEDSDGNEVESKLGFLRVSKSANLDKDPLSLSTAKLVYGKSGDIGSIVMEHPRLGIDTKVRGGLITGMNLEPWHTNFYLISGIVSNKNDTELFENYNLIDKTVTTAVMFEFLQSYNLAPILGISQTFFDVGLSAGVLAADRTQFAKDQKLTPLIYSFGLGVTKKLWFGRLHIPIGIDLGGQILSFSNNKKDDELRSYEYTSALLKAQTGIQLMINADTYIHFGAGYNLAMPFRISYEEGDDSYEAKDIGSFTDLSLGGLAIGVGIEYSIGETSVDVFGFLDPFKKY